MGLYGWPPPLPIPSPGPADRVRQRSAGRHLMQPRPALPRQRQISQSLCPRNSMAGIFPSPTELEGCRMLEEFKLSGQVFLRIGVKLRPTSKGRTVRVAVWLSGCPDCGASFTQAHRLSAGFAPARSTTGRCSACRKGPGRPIRNSRNSRSPFPPFPAATVLPVRWQQPHTPPIGPLPATRPHTPSRGGIFSD